MMAGRTPADGPDRAPAVPSVAAAKQVLRAELLDRRLSQSRGLRAVAAAALRAHVLARVIEQEMRTVACYVPQAVEPGSPVLLDALAAAGVRVLLPVLTPDLDLDWGVSSGRSSLVAGRWGVLEPSGARLGADAVCQADVVLAPALAVDRAGHRLGRGGGSYDRALARLSAAVPVVALLFDHELLDHVPVEAHDWPVNHVVTPSGGWQTLPLPTDDGMRRGSAQ